MEFQLPLAIPKSSFRISHKDILVLTGSCFTGHIGKQLADHKFPVTVNPHGILFNPISIASGIRDCISKKEYRDNDIFLLNGTWNSWDFHSAFSGLDMTGTVAGMNESVAYAHEQLSRAAYLLVTFGSAYQYFLKAAYTEQNKEHGVSNCHKAPGKWFDKQLLSVSDMYATWIALCDDLKSFNPALQIIFTVSPVRHYRDGLIENNRSKARLLELVHLLCEHQEYCHYFPAYEIVIDVLRDYRFYDPDMVHPNSQASQYVWERFADTYMEEDTQRLMKRLNELTMAMHHKERFPGTEASRKFRDGMLAKANNLQREFPFLDLEKETGFFSGNPNGL